MTSDSVGDYQYKTVHEEHPPYVLMVRTNHDALAAVATTEAANRKAKSPWHLTIETGGTHSFVTPVLLTYHPPAAAQRGTPTPIPDGLADLGFLAGPLIFGNPGLKPSAGPHHGVRPGGLTRGDIGHVPVSVQCEPAPRPPAGDRRTVVAILDTAVDVHPWLGRPDAEPGGAGFWVDARRLGWDPGERLKQPAALAGRLHRELHDQEGHGTFTAGLVRQIAPAAQVLAVHSIDADGTVHADHVLNALQWLLDGSHVRDGDVVCLPLSFRPRLPADQQYLDWLAEVLGRLANAGVTVVAAAGNDGIDDPVYPAAFAATAGIPDKRRIRSVGALNVAGSDIHAYYSNRGSWVTHWEVGVSVVSTFPQVNAAAAAEYTAAHRRSPDSDDFSAGFARWSGTSFAAAIHAAKIAAGKA